MADVASLTVLGRRYVFFPSFSSDLVSGADGYFFFLSVSVARRATATASVIATMAKGVHVAGPVGEGAKGCPKLVNLHENLISLRTSSTTNNLSYSSINAMTSLCSFNFYFS
jgi:hypothetical protein